jgi:hypothetical protein
MKKTINLFKNGFGKIAFLSTALTLGLSFLASCEDHDDHQHDENETINAIYLKFKNDSNSLDSFQVFWQDLDGIGGKAPIISDTIRLKGYASYSVSVEFFNEQDSKSEFINNEIIAEGTAHLVCYSVEHLQTVVSMSVERLDKDNKGMELGLQSRWKTYLNNFDGQVRLKLKHQPGIKNGECDPGETDAEVVFPFLIK